MSSITEVAQTMQTLLSEIAERAGRASGFMQLCARLQTKLAAHTLCIHLNRLLGNPDYLRIKSLAFPN